MFDGTWSRRASIALVGAAAAAGVALWPCLPAEMAIHFSASGTPDNYVRKAVGVALLPAVMLATMGILRGAMRYDPPDDPAVAVGTEVATMALMAAVHGSCSPGTSAIRSRSTWCSPGSSCGRWPSAGR